MEEFRRSMIQVAQGVQIFWIIGATIFGALACASYAGAISYVTGGGNGPIALGFIIGGAGAFLASATVSAILFVLIEIAENTRALRMSAAFTPQPSFETATPQLPVNKFGTWLTANGQVLTRAAATVLQKADGLGYDVRQDKDNTITITSDRKSITCSTNAEIISFGTTIL